MKQRSLIRYLCVLGAISIIFFLFTQTHKFIVVSGDSMLPTLYNGEIGIATEFTTAIPGDIYLIKEPENGFFAVKRLIGIPGDVIELKDGATYRNGELIMDEPGDSWDNQTWNLGANEYLFIGDNRGESYDGRYWSRRLRIDEILYHVDCIIFPFNSIRKVTGLT